MPKMNCWEVRNCGKGPDNTNPGELGTCAAALEESTDGVNGGKKGGRVCWAVAGTLCGGSVQGEFAAKMDSCVKCDFYLSVAKEEGAEFLRYPSYMNRLNCWEYMKCGREVNGAKTAELGVCAAASDKEMNGLNVGKNGGRICWAVAGTLCGGSVQGEFASKIANCISCEFYNRVLNEESEFVMHPTDVKKQTV